MMFLNPSKPLSTCKGDCNSCEIKGKVTCHFNMKQLLRFLAFSILPLLTGGIGIWFFNPLFLIPWALMFFTYFGFVEIRVMCSHCPHYAEPGIKSLKCWANYGAFKLWKYRPGPMSISEKTVFFIGLFLIITYPYVFLIISGNYIIMIIYTAIAAIAVWLLQTFLCTKCINFACPLNRTDKSIRKKFMDLNPVVKGAWEESKK